MYEASGREGLVDLELKQLVPGSRACGPARTVRCGQDDNLMVHAAMARLRMNRVPQLLVVASAIAGFGLILLLR